MTSPPPDERLLAYVLGTLPADQRSQLEHELKHEPGSKLAHELAATEQALTALTLTLAPRAPSPALRQRLLAATRGPARFAPFIDRLARLIDVTAARARELLASLEHSATWLTTPAPHIHLVHISGGPAVAGADVGFVRIAAGTTFPQHRHLGAEHVLILQGSYSDSTGAAARPGDLLHMPGDSSHTVTAAADSDLIYAVVVYGVEIDGIDPDAIRPPA